MKSKDMTRGVIALLAIVGGGASAQYFSLDSNPSIPVFEPPFPPFWSAEDPYGIGTPPTFAGIGGPSPTLTIGLTDGDILGPFALAGPHVVPPNGFYLNAMSPDRSPIGPNQMPTIFLDFSVDRATTGLPGSALFGETVPFGPLGVQQSGDIYTHVPGSAHPGLFVGTLTPGVLPPVPTFGGVLATAGFGGTNAMKFDESALGLTVAGAPGILIPPGVPAPAPPVPFGHDNVDAYSNTPLDVTGDLINDVEYFFSVPPAEALAVGVSSGDLFDVAPGAGGTVPIPYAPAPASGLDFFGFTSDDVDALIVWDNGLPGGPAFGGPGAEAGIDYALFSLSEGSATLAALAATGLPINGGTIFFTDFTGSFGVYLFDFDLGIDPGAAGFWGLPYANVDAMDIIPAPSAIALLALAGATRRRRA